MRIRRKLKTEQPQATPDANPYDWSIYDISDSTPPPTMYDWFGETPVSVSSPRPTPNTPTYSPESDRYSHYTYTTQESLTSQEVSPRRRIGRLLGRISLLGSSVKESYQRHKIATIAALAVSSVAIAGTGVGLHEYNSDSKEETSISQQDVGTYNLPAPSEDSLANFTKLANGECSKKTIERGAAIYEGVFNSELPTDTENLKIAAQQVLNSLEAASERAGFYPLPPEYEELRADANLDNPQIPLKVYKKFITKYLKQMGIKAIFNWDSKKDTAPKYAIPLTNYEQNFTYLRRVIVGISNGYANMTPDLIKKTGVDKIYFADLILNNTLAYVQAEGFFGVITGTDGGITLGVSNFEYAQDIESQAANTTDHEAIGHSYVFNNYKVFSCLTTVYEKLNGKIKYGKKAFDELESDGKYKGKGTLTTNQWLFTNKGKPAPTAVFAEPYGASLGFEDISTTIESASTNNRGDLFGDGDNGPIYKKLSLFIANLPKRSREYYIYALEATKILIQLYRAKQDNPSEDLTPIITEIETALNNPTGPLPLPEF